jgi:hypothetical protein
MAKMDKMVRRRELPYICRPRSMYRERIVGDAESMSMKRKKSDGQVKKKLAKGLARKSESL